MGEYLKEHGTRKTPQNEAIPGSTQVPNSDSGFAWAVDDLTRLRRFLILGSEGGSYYASERELTLENIDVVRRLAATDGAVLVAEVVRVSQAGRAPKNDPALFALACAISSDDQRTRRIAAESLPFVARTSTHLFHFVAFVQTMRGWGPSLRWAVANWYLSKPVDQLAYQVVKYRQRDGWSHRDLLRKAHPRSTDQAQRALFDWIARPDDPLVPRGSTETFSDPGVVFESVTDPYPLVRAFVAAQKADTPAQTADLVRSARLPREALRADHLTDARVWQAMLEVGMPTTALVRNLANMTRIGVLDDLGYRDRVVSSLTDQEQIAKSRIHPLQILLALRTYATGRGEKGRNVWHPLAPIIDALDEAFYLAFDNVEPTGKRQLLAIDVSGSMDMNFVAGTTMSAREAASALAMVTVQVEPNVDVVAFSAAAPGAWRKPASLPQVWPHHPQVTDGLTPVGLSRRQRLDDVARMFSEFPIGGTDCAMPMMYALDEGRDYDAFVILTDNETWAGGIHPAQALRAYREKTGIRARLAVVAMVPNRFSIADPNDPGMLDFVGFDTSAPALISEFVAGRV